MIILTVREADGTSTRIVVGCYPPAAKLKKVLQKRGAEVTVTEGDAPERSDEERQRAAEILTKIFQA